MNKVLVIKIGGSTLGSHDTTLEDLVDLQRRGQPVVVVHGGGKVINDWLAKQGVPAKFVRGERVTDRATLDVAVAVLAGLVNKELVGAIYQLGGKAIGISGVDGGLVQSKITNAELGYVGAVTGVDVAPLIALIEAGFVPVVATVCLNATAAPGEALVLNVNADTVAGDIAAVLKADRLVFLTDVDGIHDRAGKVIPHLTVDGANALVESGVASGGMIPKVKACVTAAKAKSAACIIDGRQPHALLAVLAGKVSGTIIE